MPSTKLKRGVEEPLSPELESTQTQDLKDKIKKKRSATEQADDRPATEDVEMGEFEDQWEDEFEDDEELGEVIVHPDDDEEMEVEVLANELIAGENVDAGEDQEMDQTEDLPVFLPGTQLGEGEVLVPDESTYEMFHTLNVEWPCLSFEILHDQLGSNREKYPHTTYIATGTQAANPKDNSLQLLKLSNLYKTSIQESNSEDSDDGEDNLDEDPIIENKSVPHFGGINRIRVMPHEESHIAATWSDTGKVHLWDLSELVKSMDTPGIMVRGKDLKPIHTVSCHREEGFAMDWSRRNIGKLLTGDMNHRIYLTSRTSSSFTTDSTPFVGHTSSVEDIQWSPSENNVFASCSADGTIRVWDVRAKKGAQLGVKASETDVNVLSWNRNVDYLLSSGHDDGSFSIWDLRTFISTPASPTTNLRSPAPAAHFTWHKSQITSLSFSPTDASVILVSGADGQVTLWDLSLEADTEELRVKNAEGVDVEVPSQLLFVHCQKDVKEVHWHSQIKGCIVSTGVEGFNVFKTINS